MPGTGTGGRCRFHGGASHPGGPGHHGMTQGGRYSKFLPARLRERYEEAADDPQILSNREDVALLQARITELTQRLYTGEADRVWVDLRRHMRDFDRLTREAEAHAPDTERGSALRAQANEALAEARRLVNVGATEAETWRELTKALNEKTRLARTEWKRLVDLRQLITVEQALAFASQLLNAVVRHVDDPGVRARINRDFQAALEAGGPSAMMPEAPEG